MEMSRAKTIRTLDMMFEANKYYIENNLLDECKVPYISGPPGIGKTSLIKNYAKCNNIQLNRISLTSFEYYELKGLLYPNEQTKKVEILPLDIIPTYDCLLFIDELNAADYTVQKVLLDLFHEREINGNKLSDKTMIVTAGNTKNDVIEMFDLIEPLRDRCKEIRLKNDINDVLTFLYTYCKPLYNMFYVYKHKLFDIIEKNKPVSLRGLTCVKYFVDKYFETKDSEYICMIRFYIGDELTDILINEVYDIDIENLIYSKDVNEQSLGIYRVMILHNEYNEELIKKYLYAVKKDAIITAICHMKANGLYDKLSEFNKKYGDEIIELI